MEKEDLLELIESMFQDILLSEEDLGYLLDGDLEYLSDRIEQLQFKYGLVK